MAPIEVVARIERQRNPGQLRGCSRISLSLNAGYCDQNRAQLSGPTATSPGTLSTVLKSVPTTLTMNMSMIAWWSPLRIACLILFFFAIGERPQFIGHAKFTNHFLCDICGFG